MRNKFKQYMTPEQIAFSLLLLFPFGFTEICDKHYDGLHFHIICQHGNVVADFIVGEEEIEETRTLETCWWDIGKPIPEFVLAWIKTFVPKNCCLNLNEK